EEALRLYLARYREVAAAYPQVLIAQRSLFELSSRYVLSLEGAWRSSLTVQGLLAGDGLDTSGASSDEMSARRLNRSGGTR
ncbi:MAG: hypothetical protein ACT4QD_21505, partial [Acidobacteriota bacterium]